jgi:Protein of unknown function (DUF2624).
MTILSPKKIIEYVRNYDYEITMEQAKKVIELIDEYEHCNADGTFTSNDIIETTDYIVNGKESIHAHYFE